MARLVSHPVVDRDLPDPRSGDAFAKVEPARDPSAGVRGRLVSARMAAMYNHAPPGYECFVCNVVAGDVGDRVVITENDEALAIVSRRVWANGPGHALVVPRTHYENLYDLVDSAALDISRLTRRIAIALKEAFACDGTSTRQHNEPAGNQDLWHLHVHVFPRYDGDDLYGAGYRDSTFEERRDFAARLQEVL
jgi:histidine triad (HIT) family protein